MSLEQYHLTRLIKKQSLQLGDAIALEGYEMAAPWHQVSWSNFDSISSQVAQALINFGFEVQDRVAILAQNSPQWTCADIGCLKTRAVVVPIYPTSTFEQASYIIDDAEAKLIFAGDQAHYEMACKLTDVCSSLMQVVVFDKSVSLQDNANHHYFDDLIADSYPAKTLIELDKRLEAANLDDLLTLIYTSGTTGEPKGVMLDHRNFASMVRQHDSFLPFTAKGSFGNT